MKKTPGIFDEEEEGGDPDESIMFESKKPSQPAQARPAPTAAENMMAKIFMGK